MSLVPKGKDVCAHCTGYGSSLLDPIGTDTCTVCHGSGLVDQKPETSKAVPGRDTYADNCNPASPRAGSD
jgi:DnaJ-class molecular chaperone